jgi:hypothetical protein
MTVTFLLQLLQTSCEELDFKKKPQNIPTENNLIRN